MDQKPTYEELESRVKEQERRIDRMAGDDPEDPQELFEALFESLTDAIFVLDAEAPPKIINCNPAASKSFGYTREEMIGRTTDFLHVSDAELKKFQEQLYPSIEGQGFFHLPEFRMKRADAKIFPTEHTVVPLLLKTGERIGWVSIVRDITHQKLVEKALSESEERFRTAFQTIPDPVTIIRANDGRCIDVNEGFTILTGWAREEVLGKTAGDLDLWKNPDDRDKFVEGIVKYGQVSNLEAEFKIKNAKIISGLFSAKALNLNGEPHILSITRDISERKKARKEKEALEDKLRQSQKMEAIGTLAGGVAHDFNNILATIMGYSEMALVEIPAKSSARECLQHVLKATQRAKDLINHILVISKKTKPMVMPMRLHPIVKETLELVRASLPASIEIQQNIVEEADVIMGDPNQMRQVILNLCTNAYHAIPETGGKISINMVPLELDARSGKKFTGIKPGSFLKLTVSDTGLGMDSSTVERIFDPYFSTKPSDKGTGLGLAMVHGIVANHDGAIHVESEIGKGTCFEVVLPRINQEPLPEANDSTELRYGAECILFVDDEKELTTIAKNMLEYLGYRVVIENSAVEALQAFKADPGNYDLVITDMAMPKMTGDRLVQEIKAIRSDIPLILCAGYSELVDEKKALSLGISDYLRKPISMKKLSDAARKAIELNPSE